MKTCSIDGCEKSGRITRGWCRMHYMRWYMHGDPLGGGDRYDTPEEAFIARTAWDGEHLIWTGGDSGDGYGQLHVNGRMTKAHRYAWERVNGPIPDGLVIDHACHVRACCLADHLRIATPTQNSQHRSGPTRRSVTGVRGVSKNGNRFRAHAAANGTNHYLGSFGTVEEAEAAAIAARKNLHGAFATGNN